jgi:hypothetical protein
MPDQPSTPAPRTFTVEDVYTAVAKVVAAEGLAVTWNLEHLEWRVVDMTADTDWAGRPLGFVVAADEVDHAEGGTPDERLARLITDKLIELRR